MKIRWDPYWQEYYSEDDSYEKDSTSGGGGGGWNGHLDGGLATILVLLLLSLGCQMLGFMRFIGRIPENAVMRDLQVAASGCAVIMLTAAVICILYGSGLFSLKSLLAILGMIVLPFLYAICPDILLIHVLYFALAIAAGIIPGLIAMMLTTFFNYEISYIIAVILAAVMGIVFGIFLHNPRKFIWRIRSGHKK